MMRRTYKNRGTRKRTMGMVDAISRLSDWLKGIACIPSLEDDGRSMNRRIYKLSDKIHAIELKLGMRERDEDDPPLPIDPRAIVDAFQTLEEMEVVLDALKKRVASLEALTVDADRRPGGADKAQA